MCEAVLVLPDPVQRDLDELFDVAERIEIIDGGVSEGEAMGRQLLLTLTDRDELQSMAAAMEISDSGFHCMCLGDLAVVTYGASGEQTAAIGLHHGSSIRWSERWESDALLANGDALTDWLAERGVSKLADYREWSDRLLRESEAELSDWVAAAPEGFANLARDLARGAAESMGVAPQSMADKLRQQVDDSFANSGDRIAALLRWFGAGSGKCSGFPGHEICPGELLLEHSTNDILDALNPNSEAVVEGALRLFVGWEFRGRVEELVQMPTATRQALVLAASKTTDEDKRKRAERVFGPIS